MRKLVLVLLVFAFCACGNNTEPPAPVSVQELTDTALASADFPATIMHTEPQDIELFFDFNLFDEVSVHTFIQQAMTVHLVELIIVRLSHDGDKEAIMNYLNARRDKLIGDVAFYPNQQDAADASVIGHKSGFYYLICHNDASIIEKAILEKIG